ncbi:MAG: hypothetical protein KIT18_04880 [Burkholderiales bacterium]|nr:hypothetical protein [Burkholderiales bacterium]
MRDIVILPCGGSTAHLPAQNVGQVRRNAILLRLFGWRPSMNTANISVGMQSLYRYFCDCHINGICESASIKKLNCKVLRQKSSFGCDSGNRRNAGPALRRNRTTFAA